MGALRYGTPGSSVWCPSVPALPSVLLEDRPCRLCRACTLCPVTVWYGIVKFNVPLDTV